MFNFSKITFFTTFRRFLFSGFGIVQFSLEVHPIMMLQSADFNEAKQLLYRNVCRVAGYCPINQRDHSPQGTLNWLRSYFDAVNYRLQR